MRIFKIKNPFNTLSQNVLEDTLCFQLDRYCTDGGGVVAAFHVNDPNNFMEGYLKKSDGLTYLNAATMQRITESLKESNLSEKLQIYLDRIRIDMEGRAKISLPLMTCFRSPPSDLMPPMVASNEPTMRINFRDSLREYNKY